MCGILRECHTCFIWPFAPLALFPPFRRRVPELVLFSCPAFHLALCSPRFVPTAAQEGDEVTELASDAKKAQRAQRQQQQLQLSEGELADMVRRIDAKVERLRRKRALYVEKLHRAMQRKERIAGPIQQCLKPAASPNV